MFFIILILFSKIDYLVSLRIDNGYIRSKLLVPLLECKLCQESIGLNFNYNKLINNTEFISGLQEFFSDIYEENELNQYLDIDYIINILYKISKDNTNSTIELSEGSKSEKDNLAYCDRILKNQKNTCSDMKYIMARLLSDKKDSSKKQKDIIKYDRNIGNELDEISSIAEYINNKLGKYHN